MRYPHRSNLAQLQTSTKRPLPPPPHHLPDHRRRHPRQIPPPHKRRNLPPNLPPQSEPSQPTHRQRSPYTSLLQRRSPTEIDSHVPHFSVEGWAGEEEEGGYAQCTEEGGRSAEDRGRSGGL